MTPQTIHEALYWASSFLEEHGTEAKVAEILLLHELKWTKTDLISNLREYLDPSTLKQYQKKIEQLATTKVPIQHLTGVEEFYGRSFHVNPHVLIPRPETEELIHYLLTNVKKKELSCVDVGTGSGVIAISLAKEWQNSVIEVLATDISTEALQVARKNAEKHQADIHFYHGNFLTPLIEQGKKVDMIVSNPPYIAYEEKDSLSETVKNFDPEMALFAEENGLAAYQSIIEQAPFVLNEKGILAFEIGHRQGKAVTSIIKRTFPNSEVDVIQDINQKDRIVFATIL
ncbi:peptide chain release factor N(5)-glutamine methyltransferase [Gracilibacillus kekensis]|uniref:Release factor glutamine methyltransferase n=1 Tax=Gracilibacillus kekensis TaxID=1027249 RepID=A0A1M7KBU0_9BACI|nr:peptide chain release factor N(5)-glutamine methyltransferase [Gracilibacillus kekensis]SHM62631.1 release factor glutamine methyltransferase [Gracilibacillus kekensis]